MEANSIALHRQELYQIRNLVPRCVQREDFLADAVQTHNATLFDVLPFPTLPVDMMDNEI